MRQSCKTCKYFYRTRDGWNDSMCRWHPEKVSSAMRSNLMGGYGFLTSEGSGRTCKCYVAKAAEKAK